jgi:hypothetical protein
LADYFVSDFERSDVMSETTVSFWDCECDENYIRPKTQASCKECGRRRDDENSPDSRIDEIYNAYEVGIWADHISKGMIVAEEDGVLSTVMSNKLGIFRDIKRDNLFGGGDDYGTMYIFDMFVVYLPEDTELDNPMKILLTKDQERRKQQIRSAGF